MPPDRPEENFERLDGFLLNAIEDAPDFRDYPYDPALVRLRDAIEPPAGLRIFDQGSEGACTGFGLAAVINLQLAERGEERTVSPRMLYEMAKKFDEWGSGEYAGSSCRGAVKGWHGIGDLPSPERGPAVSGRERPQRAPHRLRRSRRRDGLGEPAGRG